MSDKWNLFCIILAIELCCALTDSEDYLLQIRNDYCTEYCNGMCLIYNEIDCNQNKFNITTDKYNFQLSDRNGILTWNTNFIDLASLKKLNSSSKNTKVKLQNLIINTNTNNNDKLYQKSEFLEVLGVSQVDEYEFKKYSTAHNSYETLIRITNKTHLNLTISEFREINSAQWNDFISQSTEKYTTIKFIGNKKKAFKVRVDIFENQNRLENLIFHSITLDNLREETFNNLTTLKSLEFTKTKVNDYSFLRSPTLENKWLQLQTDDEELWKHYKHLPMPKTKDRGKNLTANFCFQNYITGSQDCTHDSDGRPCPKQCECKLDYQFTIFTIDCKKKGLKDIPELPKPNIEIVSLNFENNYLMKLPNVTNVGFQNVRRLYLANNKLKSLELERIPKKLNFLDIRNNSIDTLDSEVAKFFLDRGNNMYLLQDKIRWKCDCANVNLVQYLGEIQLRQSVLHDDLDEKCPDNCRCCSNGTNKHFVIDCRNLTHGMFPRLPKTFKTDTALMLDNNSLVDLLTMRDSNLKHLHLSHNDIKDLEMRHLPENLTFLDISNNKLEELDDEIIDFLDGRKFELSGNPWLCSCKYTKFLKYLQTHMELEYNAALQHCIGSEGFCPDECFCCKEDDTQLFKIDCENKGFLEIPKLPTKPDIKLVFNRNNLTILNTVGFNNIKELELRFNRIEKIESVPRNLISLNIQNNRMKQMEDHVVNSLKRSLSKLYISGNSWDCECKELVFIRFTKDLALKIEDLCNTQCSDSKMLVKVEEKDVCSKGIPLFVFLFISLMILFAFLNWLQFFWKSISLWLYENNILAGNKTDDDKRYDCFLAYCHKDSDFLQEFIDNLENEPASLRLCYYARDWLPGEPIPACICKSVEDSKRIIILMTKNFLKSVWGRLEFRMALHATAKDKCKRLIVIVYPDVQNFDDLDSELKTYMKLNTYLKRDDPSFWDKLLLAMPIEAQVGKDIESAGTSGVIEIELNQYTS